MSKSPIMYIGLSMALCLSTAESKTLETSQENLCYVNIYYVVYSRNVFSKIL